MATGDVYVSYAWQPEVDSGVVGKLEAACSERGIMLHRDVREVNYGESIRAYMDTLAAGRHVVVVLSDSYFKSSNCLYELREIHKHKSLLERVYPIVLRGTSFRGPLDRIPYVAHWKSKTGIVRG